MASGGKKRKTTMAKLARENKLRERRLDKQAKRDARRASAADRLDSSEAVPPSATADEGDRGTLEQAALDPVDEDSMPRHRPADHDLTIEKAVKHLFPKEAAEAAKVETRHEDKPDRDADPGLTPATTSAKDLSLRRLREAPDEKLAVFEDRLRQDALAAGASEQELREAQVAHPGHS